MSTEPLDWTGDGPRSLRFGDVYFSTVDGLAESRAVFLAGCGLPQAWAGRSRFTVAELGFGTGLNILALVELWGRTRAPGARLNIFSIEGFPIAAADARRALLAWPELGGLAAPLLAQWQAGRRGLHRIEWPEAGVILDLMIAPAGPALAGWHGAADAWFLDGFAPARNPEMWSPELLALVAARSNGGAKAATFTIAGAVRRGLEAAGFDTDKRPGFGRKRERLEAWLPGQPPAEPAPPSVAVVGGGVAGASLVRAFRALGAEPVLYEAAAAGAGASGNPAALVAPRLDAGMGAAAALHAEAFARAVQLYRTEVPEAVIASGAVQLETGPRDAARFDRLAGWDGFAEGGLQRLAAQASGEGLGGAGFGLMLRDALTVDPAPVLRAWLAGTPMVQGRVAALACEDGTWRLLDAGGALLGEARIVVLATGPAVRDLTGLPLRAVRGQASWSYEGFTGTAASWGGYVAPMRNGVLFGATHDREDTDLSVRPEDHHRNLRTLAEGRPDLAATLQAGALHGRASLRASLPDHMPAAGALADRPGLHVLTALGGRGFALAPLLAEQVAAAALGAPRPLARALARTVDPDRYRDGERIRSPRSPK